MSSFTREKDVLANILARCQHQLARSHVEGVVARGNFQWVLENGVVHVIDEVIESAEVANGVPGVREACEALGFEKGKRLGGCSISVGEPDDPDPGRVARRAKEVDAALSSSSETDFAGLFRLGKLDHDSFCQFCSRSNPRGSSSDS